MVERLILLVLFFANTVVSNPVINKTCEASDDCRGVGAMGWLDNPVSNKTCEASDDCRGVGAMGRLDITSKPFYDDKEKSWEVSDYYYYGEEYPDDDNSKEEASEDYWGGRTPLEGWDRDTTQPFYNADYPNDINPREKELWEAYQDYRDGGTILEGMDRNSKLAIISNVLADRIAHWYKIIFLKKWQKIWGGGTMGQFEITPEPDHPDPTDEEPLNPNIVIYVVISITITVVIFVLCIYVCICRKKSPNPHPAKEFRKQIKIKQDQAKLFEENKISNSDPKEMKLQNAVRDQILQDLARILEEIKRSSEISNQKRMELISAIMDHPGPPYFSAYLKAKASKANPSTDTVAMIKAANREKNDATITENEEKGVNVKAGKASDVVHRGSTDVINSLPSIDASPMSMLHKNQAFEMLGKTSSSSNSLVALATPPTIRDSCSYNNNKQVVYLPAEQSKSYPTPTPELKKATSCHVINMPDMPDESASDKLKRLHQNRVDRDEKARSVHEFQKGDEQEVGVDVESSSLNFLFTPNKKPDFEI